MQPFQQRVVEEADDLLGKIGRLKGFMHNPKFLELPLDEQERMKLQAQHMADYHGVLSQRIAAFED